MSLVMCFEGYPANFAEHSPLRPRPAQERTSIFPSPTTRRQSWRKRRPPPCSTALPASSPGWPTASPVLAIGRGAITRALAPAAVRRPAGAAARSRRAVPRRRRHAGSAAEAGPEAGHAAIRSHPQLLRPVGGPAAGPHRAAAVLALAAAAGAAGRRRAGAAGGAAARSGDGGDAGGRSQAGADPAPAWLDARGGSGAAARLAAAAAAGDPGAGRALDGRGGGGRLRRGAGAGDFARGSCRARVHAAHGGRDRRPVWLGCPGLGSAKTPA